MPSRLIFSFIISLIYSGAFSQTSTLLIGTYTSGKSEGIYVYNFNSSTGDNKFVNSVKTVNPSYLAVSPNQKMVYAVNETAVSTPAGTGGSISAFSFNKENGSLTPVNKQFSGGKDPCYVSIDNTGKWAIVSNYSSGRVALFPLKEDGSLDSARQVIQHFGKGLNKERQEQPHTHSVVLSRDNKYLFAPDLGIDKVMIYHFDNVNGKLSPATPPFASSVGGSGPRHFDIHPNNHYAYLMEEISGTVQAFKYGEGKLTPIQRISALPAGFKGEIGSADIHVSRDGKFLYCSNRGASNTIAIFKIDEQSGKLTTVGYQSTLGKTPRNFNFDPAGNFLLVANQESDDVVIFKIDKVTGKLTDTGKKINIPNPVCVKWIN